MNSFDEKLLKIVSNMTSAGGSSGDSSGSSSGGSTVVGNNPFKGKWISILGDGISTFSGYIPSTQTALDQEGIETVNKTWWHQLITKLGAKLCVNYSGSGIMLSGNKPLKSVCYNKIGRKLHRVEGTEYINIDGTKETATENINPDIIFVYLGTNDFLDNAELGTMEADDFNAVSVSSTIYVKVITAYMNILYYLMKDYPYASVYLIVPQILKPSGTDTEYPFLNTASTPWSMALFIEYVRRLAIKYSAKFIPLSNLGVTGSDEFCGDGKFLLADAIHPSAEGHKLIANYCYYTMLNDPVNWNTRNEI